MFTRNPFQIIEVVLRSNPKKLNEIVTVRTPYPNIEDLEGK
jgi:hypothetical protein